MCFLVQGWAHVLRTLTLCVSFRQPQTNFLQIHFDFSKWNGIWTFELFVWIRTEQLELSTRTLFYFFLLFLLFLVFLSLFLTHRLTDKSLIMIRFFAFSFVLVCAVGSLSLPTALSIDPNDVHQLNRTHLPFDRSTFDSTSDSLNKHLDSDLILESSVLRHTSAVVPGLSQQPIRQDTYMYSNFKLPPSTVQMYLPGDQFCPETGRTVCSDVYSYPV